MPITYGPHKAGFTRAEVDRFRAQWPCCTLRSRAYWFEFDANGDLVDTDVPEHDDGAAALALSHDAQAYLDGTEPAWL